MEQLSTLTHYAQLMLYQYRILQFTEFDVVMVQQYPMIFIWIKCVLILNLRHLNNPDMFQQT